ncbi:MAG TPA: cytochrome c [Chthoniobacterales bacterium]|jgi:mono/diheme cytochrome c family protein|nr:cytochrome c [Chthoniobacterales bacterium]
MNESAGGGQQRQGMDYGETSDVHQVHSAIQREKREPRAGLEPLSIWLIAVYGLAIFFGGAYLGRFSGNFSGDSLDPALIPSHTKSGPQGPGGPTTELSQADRGKKIFSQNCAVCHQPNGLGAASQGYPPLAGSEYVNGGTRRLGMILLKGLHGPVTVKGQQFGAAVMQAWDTTLTDAKIADVLTYIRQEWGNKGGPVAAAQISALRKELASHPESFVEGDLKAVPEDAELPGGEPAGANPPDAKAPPPAPKQ